MPLTATRFSNYKTQCTMVYGPTLVMLYFGNNWSLCYFFTGRDKWLINTLTNIEYKLDKLSRQLTVFIRDSMPATSLPDGIKLPVLTFDDMGVIEGILQADKSVMEKLVSGFYPNCVVVSCTCWLVPVIVFMRVIWVKRLTGRSYSVL
jgi:hypothetical protein